MSEFISEDQMNDLLNQQESDAFGVKDVDDEASEPAEDSGPDYNALTSVFEMFNEQAQSVISNVLNIEIKFSISKCEGTNQETIKEAVKPPVLSITLPFEGGVKGELYAIITTKDVAVLSDIMMMGDGSAEYTEDHKDAISELFNQVTGAFAASLSGYYEDSISTGTIEAKEYDFSDSSVPFENSDMVLMTIKITDKDESAMSFIVPQELSTQLMKGLKETRGDAEGGSVGLSESEVDDLTQLSTDISEIGEAEGGFKETPLSETTAQAPKENINMLLDVEMNVSIELGKTDMSIKRILELSAGSIIELDRMAGEPVDLMVNNKVVAKGEVVVVDENFGIRIVSLVSPEERIRSLR